MCCPITQYHRRSIHRSLACSRNEVCVFTVWLSSTQLPSRTAVQLAWRPGRAGLVSGPRCRRRPLSGCITGHHIAPDTLAVRPAAAVTSVSSRVRQFGVGVRRWCRPSLCSYAGRFSATQPRAKLDPPAIRRSVAGRRAHAHAASHHRPTHANNAQWHRRNESCNPDVDLRHTGLIAHVMPAFLKM